MPGNSHNGDDDAPHPPVTLPPFCHLKPQVVLFWVPTSIHLQHTKMLQKKENKFVNHKGDKSGGGVHSEPCHWTCGLCPAVKGKLQDLSIFHVLVPRNIHMFALYDRVNMWFLFIRTCLYFYNGTQWDSGIHLTHFRLMHDFPGT